MMRQRRRATNRLASFNAATMALSSITLCYNGVVHNHCSTLKRTIRWRTPNQSVTGRTRRDPNGQHASEHNETKRFTNNRTEEDIQNQHHSPTPTLSSRLRNKASNVEPSHASSPGTGIRQFQPETLLRRRHTLIQHTTCGRNVHVLRL
jgi:hypothetical protein